MILKFDHISYSCGLGQEFKRILPNGYREAFREMDLSNISCKQRYLRHGSRTHNIFMFQPTGSDLPIEVTQYPTVTGKNEALQLMDGEIQWDVEDLASAVDFFACLDAKEHAGSDQRKVVEITPFLEKAGIRIHLREKKADRKRRTFLDVEGFSSLAFFVDDARKYLAGVHEAGFFGTEISSIAVNGKWLDIAFVEGANGELVELISLMKGRG